MYVLFVLMPPVPADDVNFFQLFTIFSVARDVMHPQLQWSGFKNSGR